MSLRRVHLSTNGSSRPVITARQLSPMKDEGQTQTPPDLEKISVGDGSNSSDLCSSPASSERSDVVAADKALLDGDYTYRHTILVTGGAGFIGSHVSHHLLSRGHKVVVIDNFNELLYSRTHKERNVELLQNEFAENFVLYEGDICNDELLDEVFCVHKPEYVMHLAGQAGVRPSIEDPVSYVRSNIEGTTKLLDRSVRSERKVKNFVFASSSSVYGNDTPTPFREDAATSTPVSPYAATKKACELMAYTYHSMFGLDCIGLRFFTVYGPRGRPDMAMFKFIDSVYKGQPINLFGNGDSMRDYTYVDDIVAGCVSALFRPMGYAIFNLGNSSPVDLNTLVETIENVVGRKAVKNFTSLQIGDVDVTYADITRAQELLNYSPQTTLADGIGLTVDWYKTEFLQWEIDVMKSTASGHIDSTRNKL